MEIYLVRHGEYIDFGSETPEQDSQNPLSEVGIAKLQRQAATLAGWKLPVERILTSPFVRSKHTAEILAEQLQVPVEEHIALIRTQFDLQGLKQIIERYAQTRHLMLVGHESDLSTVAAEVIGGGQLELARGGMIRLSLTALVPLQGKLVWLLSPQVMEA